MWTKAPPLATSTSMKMTHYILILIVGGHESTLQWHLGMAVLIEACMARDWGKWRGLVPSENYTLSSFISRLVKSWERNYLPSQYLVLTGTIDVVSFLCSCTIFVGNVGISITSVEVKPMVILGITLLKLVRNSFHDSCYSCSKVQHLDTLWCQHREYMRK